MHNIYRTDKLLADMDKKYVMFSALIIEIW